MARVQQKMHAAGTTGVAGSSGLPCATVLRLIRDLPGVPGLLATVIGAMPSIIMRSIITDLTPASGRQDHAISPSAFAPPVSRRQSVHRIPRSTSVTIAIRPSCRGGTAQEATNWKFKESELFLRAGLDHPNQLEAKDEIRFLAHAVFGGSRVLPRTPRCQNGFDLPDEQWRREALDEFQP
jgi:hypothetical protein